MKADNTNCILNSMLFPIKNNMLFFVFMYLLGAVCIIFEPFAWYGSRLFSLLELCVDDYLVCLFIELFPRKSKHIIRFIICIIFYSIAIIDMTCYVRLGVGIHPVYFQNFVHSNIHETSEMLQTYLSPSVFVSPLLLIVLLLLLHIIFSLRKIKQAPILTDGFKKTIKIIVALVLLISLVTSLNNKKYLFYRVICQKSELEFQEKYFMTPLTGYYLPVYRLAYSFSEYNSLKPVTKKLRHTLNKNVVDSCTYTSPNIVIIIGESYNRSHSALYGYSLPTTPYQNTLYESGKLIPFTNVICSWNMTCESFENMLSLHAIGDKGQWYDYPFFTSMAKEAGYQVFFISNQFVSNPSESFSAFIEDIFMNDEEISNLQFSDRNKGIHSYDIGLIDDYNQLNNSSSLYHLWIFHTMGLHAKFSERYPSKWKRFKASDYHRSDLTKEQLEELADYDNAILYNDYVLNNIVNCFKDEEAIIFFLPDHGERVFDNSTEFGRNLTWDPNDIIQQFQIPFWFYMTDTYLERHPDIFKAILSAKDKRYMTDIISHTVVHLAGIKSKYYQSKYDILSPAYQDKRKRIIRNQRDYDEIINNN